MSHQGPDGETQGTGFYGIRDKCSALPDHLIPDCFRLTTQSGTPVDGTSLVIVGFQTISDWRSACSDPSVIGSFFYAIGTGRLSVMVEPEESGGRRDVRD